MQTELSGEILSQALAGRFFGRGIHWYSQAGSTNTEAHRLAREGAPEGTLVIADHQTSGRGRRGREWLAPAGSCLLFSLVFRPPLAANRAQTLTMISALATLDAVSPLVPVPAFLKWPNDLVAGGRKLCGILTELGTVDGSLDYVVVGIGLNVNWRPEDTPALAAIATSVLSLSRRVVPRLPLLLTLLDGVTARYERLCRGETPTAEWASRLETIGRTVTVETTGGVVRGLATGVDHDGALQVRRADGSVARIMEGDVLLAHAV